MTPKPALVGHHHAGDAVALANDVGHDRVVEELGAGLLHEAVGLELEALDVEVNDVPVEIGQRLADLGVEAEACADARSPVAVVEAAARARSKTTPPTTGKPERRSTNPSSEAPTTPVM